MDDARLAQAETALRGGRPSAAVALASAVLATAGTAPEARRSALVLRAQAHEELRDFRRAIDDVRAAIALGGRDARIQNRLGILLVDAGDLAGGIGAFAAAVEIDPTHGRAWNNLGNALRSAGRIAEALAALQRAVTTTPDNLVAWCNLGVVQRELGDPPAAMASFGRALALAPNHRPALMGLAGILRALGRIDEAITYYASAARLDASDHAVLLALAGTLSERDDLALARGAYRTARAKKPHSLRAAIGDALSLPMVHADGAAVAAARADFAAGLDRLESEIPSLVRGRSFGDVIDDLCWSNFLLAYHGEDDRALQARYAGLVGRAIELVGPEWRTAPRRTTARRRVRVGIASAFIVDGTVGRYFRSWIAGLDRTRFEIYVYHLHRELTSLIRELAPGVEVVRRFADVVPAPSAIAPTIRNDNLDVLIYPELGMDATTFALAALRLAPVQCTAWGHPVTTGHATIDVFFSCAAMEPPGADAHYTERLILLPGIGTDYARPSIPADADRARFGLPEGVPLFLCPQSLFKIHPDSDALFARVLAASPAARIVAFEGRHHALTAKFRARFASALTREGLRVDERLILLPQCGHDDYMRLNAVSDAMLDTVRWSGGNTSLDALGAGLPIVTLPGRFMRGRQSAGMLGLAGIDELIARNEEDYVHIAARLAADRDWRAALRARTVDAHVRLFADKTPLRALADAIERLARET